MLQLKYNPIYELLLSVTLLFEPQLDTPQIISRLNNVVTYLFDSPERSEEFPEFLEISNNLYETVRINEPRLNDEILYEKAMSKINEAIDPLYAVLEIVLYI